MSVNVLSDEALKNGGYRNWLDEGGEGRVGIIKLGHGGDGGKVRVVKREAKGKVLQAGVLCDRQERQVEPRRAGSTMIYKCARWTRMYR